MTITEPTCTNPQLSAPAHRSLPYLEDFLAQATAAIALGRRLAAEADPAWQLYDVKVGVAGFSPMPNLRLWTKRGDAESVQLWSGRLDVPVTVSRDDNDNEKFHHTVDGVIDGVPVHVWTIVRLPITNIAICENRGAGWHVGYDQGGVRKLAFFGDEAAARAWAATYSRAVAA